MKYHILTQRSTVAECKITHPSDVYQHLMRYTKERQEHMLVITLNGAHMVMKIHVVSIGIMNRALVHPREVFYPAIKDNAAAIVLAHNHPSGNLQPSQEDKSITDRIGQAGKLLGIPMLDHLIISPGGYYSALESGELGW